MILGQKWAYPISTHHMLVEGCSHSRVFCFSIPRLKPIDAASMRQRFCGNICSDSGLIIVKLAFIATIKHAINLQNIRVCIRTRKFVASTIKAEDEFFALSVRMGIRVYRDSRLVVVAARACLSLRSSLLIRLQCSHCIYIGSKVFKNVQIEVLDRRVQ